jgi:hypothetical protein
MKALLAAFQDSVTIRSGTQAPPPSPFATYALEAAPDHAYAGQAACQPCHSQEYTQWQGTPHAHAFDTLRQQNRHFFPQCVGCHTTGFGLPGGFALDQPREAGRGVQCEGLRFGPAACAAARGGQYHRQVDPNLPALPYPGAEPEVCPAEAGKIDTAPRPGTWSRCSTTSATGPCRLELVMSLCPMA